MWNECACVLTLSDPDSEDTEEEEECCWGLEMDMGESALCGDTESLCCSSDPTPVLTTQGTCSDTSGFGGETTKAEGPDIYVCPPFHSAFKLITFTVSNICFYRVTEGNTCRTDRPTSVVSPSHVPAPPLLNDPLPVVDHFLGQPNYPAQGAVGGRGGRGGTEGV